jgi:pimeloyl-ACP methyl ester carboxylesterase
MSFADVKGIRTFYREYGNAKDEDVLFIHGLGSSSIVWRDIPDALSVGYHAIAIDLVGFGMSDKPEEPGYYTIEGFSKFIADFLETIVREKRESCKLTLIGHSLGGYIATQIAIEHKEKIEKLVLVDSSGLLEGPTPLLNDYYAAAMEINPIRRYEKIKRVLEDMHASPSRLLPIGVDLFEHVIEKQGARQAFESSFKNSTTTQIKPEGFKAIQDIQCLVLWGEKDNLIPVRYCDRFRERLPRAKYEIIQDAGHAPFVEKTALFYQKLTAFLNHGNVNNY